MCVCVFENRKQGLFFCAKQLETRQNRQQRLRAGERERHTNSVASFASVAAVVVRSLSSTFSLERNLLIYILQSIYIYYIYYLYIYLVNAPSHMPQTHVGSSAQESRRLFGFKKPKLFIQITCHAPAPAYLRLSALSI